MADTRRIAKNTFLLYIRMAVMLFISLFTSRIILSTLGIDDYGIYNAVGGFVGLFSLMSGALTNAVSRYITFALGKNDIVQMKKVFSTSVNVMLLLSTIVIIVGEILGIWFLTTHLNIPEDRLYATHWVFQCSLATFVINLLSVPYNSTIIAHEKMGAFAYISILQAVFQLIIVYLLYISFFDKLITYSILLLIVGIIIRIIYATYCKRHFEEATYHKIYDKHLIKDMTCFAGWNFLAQGASVLNNQGISILLNVFFGVTVNAARGVAQTIADKATIFASNFIVAINPQITKSYASGDYSAMHELIFKGARYSFYLMLILVLPLCLEIETILNIWLEEVPEHTIVFARWTMCTMLIGTLSSQLIVGLHATGRLKNYMIVVGGIELLCMPLTFLAFKLGASLYYAYYIYFIVYTILLFVRLYMIKDLIYLSGKLFIRKVILNVLQVTLLSLPAPLSIVYIQTASFIRLIEVCILSFLSILIVVLFVGMEKQERTSIISIIKQKLHLR